MASQTIPGDGTFFAVAEFYRAVVFRVARHTFRGVRRICLGASIFVRIVACEAGERLTFAKTAAGH
jgi:hypothetical protein